MGLIIGLILISLIIALIFLGGYLWAVKNGQYDDTDSPPVRMLYDEKRPDSASPPKK